MQIYIDGEYYSKAEAKISVFDHGLLYGDGIFEGIRAYNGGLFRLREHMVRLYESAKTIALDIPLPLEQLEQDVIETVRRNNLRDAYIRLIVTRGAGDLGIDPRKCAKASIIIIATSISLYPEEMYENGLSVITVPTRRNHSEMVNPRVKSLNYLNNILAKEEGNHLGYAEVVMLNSDGYVVEGSADNIFIVKNGVLITPPAFLGILKGITREVVMELAQAMGTEVRETVFTRHDLYNADECFFTGTGAELIPVVEVDGRSIGTGKPGEMTKQLLAAFRKERTETGVPIYPCCQYPSAS